MYSKKWKRTKKAISFMTTFAMLSSAMGTAVASASVRTDSQEYELTVSDNQPVQSDTQAVNVSGAVKAGPDTQPVGSAKTQTPPAIDTTVPPASGPTAPTTTEPVVPDNKPDGDGSGSNQLPDNSGTTDKTTGSDFSDVYDKMIKLKDKYHEGMTWTNFEPYGTKGNLGSAYKWNGGKILGNVSSGVGCAAFAFILSDEAFGDLPAREIYDIKYENVNVGDILRVNNNSHSVIVLRKTDAGLVVAEGNYNKTVHWGRVISKDDFLKNTNFIVTRYPNGYTPSDVPETVETNGTEGSNLTWTLTNMGTLTISGSGNIGDYDYNNRPSWETAGTQINTIVIENGITGIGNYAFDKSTATSVHLPASLTAIGPSAFRESKILSVTIPGSVRTIGNDAFRACQGLISATVSEGVQTIGERAFESCNTLRYIDFPSTITSVGAGAFMQCQEMTRVRFMPGSGEVAIGDDVFKQCWRLTDVTLPEKADCISAGMFSNCSMLPVLYIPAGIKEVKGLDTNSGGPFSECTALKEINFAGDEAAWNSKGGNSAITYSGLQGKVTVNFNVPFPDPFAKDPDDPGDLITGDHAHSWSSEWKNDNTNHWHECTVAGCPVTNNSEKNSYGTHSFGSWVVDTGATSSQSGSKHRDCTVCSYRETSTIPATGSGSSGGSNGSGSSGSSGGSVSPGNPVTPGSPSTPSSPSSPSVPDSPDTATGPEDPDDTDNNTNNPGDNSGDTDSSNKPGDTDITDNDNDDDESDSSNNSGGNLKKQKTKFKKKLNIGLEQQIKPVLKTKLKKRLKEELKQKAKLRLKKQLRMEMRPMLKDTLKKQLKKQFGEALGEQFDELFNEEFRAQYNQLFNEEFNLQYKKLVKKLKN